MRWPVVLVIAIDTLFNVFSSIFVIWTFMLAIESQINQGVVTSLFSLSSVFMAIIGTIVFHEHMKSYHYLGMGLMIICSLLISFSHGASKQAGNVDVLGQSVAQIHPVWSVLMAILCPICFAIANILT